MNQNKAWNRRKLSSHAALPNENVVGLHVIDAADDATKGDIATNGKYFGERGKGGKLAQTHTSAVLEQLHHKVMYAPVTKIMGAS